VGSNNWWGGGLKINGMRNLRKVNSEKYIGRWEVGSKTGVRWGQRLVAPIQTGGILVADTSVCVINVDQSFVPA